MSFQPSPLWLDTLPAACPSPHRGPSAWPGLGPRPDDLVFLALAHGMEGTLVTGNLKDFPQPVRGAPPCSMPGIS